VLESGVTVGALVAANPVGSVTTPGGRHFWAAPFEIDGEFGGAGVDPRSGLILSEPSRKLKAMGKAGNTTLCIVATDARLSKAQCHRISIMAHDGISRAIMPAHTPHDGDIVFALSTGDIAVSDDAVSDIGTAAAHCVARAIGRAVYLARPAAQDMLSTWSQENH